MDSLHLDPKTSALVLIDLQKGIASMPTEPLPSTQVIANANRLVSKFHEKGGYVVFVHVASSPDGRDMLRPDADEPMISAGPRAEDWADFVPELERGEGDLIVTKHQWGAFYGTELDLQLRRRGISTIVLGGIATNYGVESTARDAYERGYRLLFASDAMASRAASDHEFALQRIFPRIGRIRTAAQILEAMSGDMTRTPR